MKPYPAYKWSGVEWVGSIPKNWKLTKIKWLLNKIGSGVTPRGGAQVYQDIGIPLLRSQNIHFYGLRLDDVAYISEEIYHSMIRSAVKPGDVLFNITGASIGRCTYAPSSLGKANVNQHVCIMRPREKTISTEYLAFSLSSHLGQQQVFSNQMGTSREGLNYEQLGDFLVAFPPIPEQHAIADFLDRKTAQINTLIEKKQRQIELLQEQRTALINQAVTKGLDPTVPMKDSSIEWLGEIPAHWKVIRNRFLFREKVHRSKTGQETLLMVHQKLGVVERNKYMKHRPVIADSLVGYKVCAKDDLVLNRMKAHLGVFYKVPQPGIVSPDYTVFNKISNIETEYYQHLFRHPGYVIEFIRNSKGVALGFFRLYTPEFYDIFSLAPPVEEQREILAFIHQQTGLIDQQMSLNSQLINYLKEYRTALISAAVTGRIDVREE